MKAFLRAFAQKTGIDETQANERWAAFSVQLSDKQRAKIERGGAKNGEIMGEEWLKMYGKNNLDNKYPIYGGPTQKECYMDRRIPKEWGLKRI